MPKIDMKADGLPHDGAIDFSSSLSSGHNMVHATPVFYGNLLNHDTFYILFWTQQPHEYGQALSRLNFIDRLISRDNLNVNQHLSAITICQM